MVDTSTDIQQATVADILTILQFIRDLAEFENSLDEVLATEDDLQRALFGADARAHSVICRVADKPVGFALFFYNYSTWTGKYGLFLEDLYVDRAARGTGAGKALLKYLARLAVERDCGRFEWNVLDWNQSAIDFYESFGARPQSEWVGYRLSGEALQTFASEH